MTTMATVTKRRLLLKELLTFLVTFAQKEANQHRLLPVKSRHVIPKTKNSISLSKLKFKLSNLRNMFTSKIKLFDL